MDQELILFELDRRARSLHLRMGELCRISGVSPSTPSRWKAGVSANIATINKLKGALDRLEAERAL